MSFVERQMLIKSLRNIGSPAEPFAPNGKQGSSRWLIIRPKTCRLLSYIKVHVISLVVRLMAPHNEAPLAPKDYKHVKFLYFMEASRSVQLLIHCSRCNPRSNPHTSNRDGKLQFLAALCRISFSVLRRIILTARRSWSLTLLALKIDPYP